MSQTWTSAALAVDVAEDAPWQSAELIFEQVLHDGSSFVVEVFLRAADPGADGESADAHGGQSGEPAGSPAQVFTVFAHGDCWGDDPGHCTPPDPLHEFDRRAPHPLKPRNIAVDVTDGLRALGAGVEAVIATAVATSRGADSDDLLRFSRLTLVTYD